MAAILAADVAGFTRMMSADEAATIDLLKSHRAVTDACIEACGGRIANTAGDSIIAVFESATDAVEAAVKAQTTIAERNDAIPAKSQMHFRVGINIGEVVADGEDVLGDGVNIAARLESMADAGGICISGNVHEQINKKIDLECQYLGEQEARNVSDPIPAYRVLLGRQPFKSSPEMTDERGELALPERPSVLIVPFSAAGGDPDVGSLAEGLWIDVQNALTRVSGIFLIAAASAKASLAGPAEKAATDYAVRYMLEGNVRKAGNRVRVSMTLTDTMSGEIVWADQLDRNYDDTFAIYDEITARVLTAINVKLVAGEPAKIWHRSLQDIRSLQALYEGIFAFFRMTEDAMPEARSHFERVAKWNPESSIGPTWLAVSHWIDFQRGWSAPRSQSLQRAKASAEKAIGLSGCDGQAYTVLCHLHLVEEDFDAALELGRKAISIRPNCTAAHSHFASVLHYCGDQDAALQNIKLAMRFSPIQQPIYKEVLARIYRAQEKYDQAVETAEQTIAANRDCLFARLVLASIGVIRDDRAREQQIRDDILRIEPAFSVAQFAEGEPYRDKHFLKCWVSELREAGLPG